MAYIHNKEWTLFSRPVTLRGGHTRTIYFFSRNKPKSGQPTEMPDGYRVGVNGKTGLPFLKKA